MTRTRICPRALVTGAVLVFGIAGCAAASAGVDAWTGDVAYAWAPGETLRYRLTSETSAMGMEEQRLQRRLRARIGVAFAEEGRATARIEEAREEVRGTDPPVRRAGPEVAGQPVALAVGRLGVDSIVGDASSLPVGWLDVMNELRTLFPRLPGGPLPAGRTWTDTKRFDLSTDTAWAEPQTRHRSYRVAGDSTIRGVPVVVVEYHERRTREVRRRRPPPLPPPGGMLMPAPTVVLTVTEDERGRFYFDARAGRLVRLRRTVAVHKERPSHMAESALLLEEHRQTLELVSATPPAGR